MTLSLVTLLTALGVIVTLQLASLGYSVVNARLASSARSEAEAARDAAQAARESVRGLRSRVVEVETVQDQRRATDGGEEIPEGNR